MSSRYTAPIAAPFSRGFPGSCYRAGLQMLGVGADAAQGRTENVHDRIAEVSKMSRPHIGPYSVAQSRCLS